MGYVQQQKPSPGSEMGDLNSMIIELSMEEELPDDSDSDELLEGEEIEGNEENETDIFMD